MTKEQRRQSDPNQYQQGDVWIERIPEIPAGAEQVNGVTLAEGEGLHLHRFAVAADVELYVKDGMRFARVKKETAVEHVTRDGRQGEHDPITLPAGNYQFGQVIEYDYLSEMSREIVD
jgi:hypothetical protein